MHALPLYKTESVDKLVWPEGHHKLSLDSPALNILTDFKEHTPLVVHANTKAVELEKLMKQSHVKMKIVLDADGQFAGIVSLSDLSEQAIMQKVSKEIHRHELTAFDFMQSKASLQSFDYDELRRATVGDVVETLKDNGQQHCLVVDRKEHEIRGIISVSDIARELKLPLDIQTQPTFSGLSRILAA